jgi:para-aminobenzoate synthetase component 1
MTAAGAIPLLARPARTRPAPWPADAEAVFAPLAGRRGCVWLDSAGGPAAHARYSVLAAEPAAVLVHQGGVTRLIEPTGRVLLESRAAPLQALGEVLAALAGPPADAGIDAALPYGPGLYGYLAYDLAPTIEPTAPLAARADIALPDLWLGVYDAVLVMDHHTREARLVGADGEAMAALEEAVRRPSPAGRRSAAKRLASEAANMCRSPSPNAVAVPSVPQSLSPSVPSCNFTRPAYLTAVERAREYIAAGDIFQVNLSRRFTAAQRPDAGGGIVGPADLYRRLRRANPAPYAAYLGLGAGRAVLSSSPELFLDLGPGGRVVTRPIKGTRPRRPGDDAFNCRMAAELEASAKDRAELVMIVDLERNDLGRVCAYGSVRVTQARAIESYATVHHTVATVEGRLRPGCGVADLLAAAFPGGSITGAPKVRAMQIIAQLEPTRRSLYTGAIGYVAPPRPGAPAGRCVLNIAIRTLLAAGPHVHLQAGGGIVADSDPVAEFDETTAKARAMLAALGMEEDT